jgi:8-hydroxy-5-deazaflavin:NADPH oxidoreductase
MGRIAILGGTGPEGLGLGMRFSLAGEEVVLGSRQAERAVEAAAAGSERLRGVGCTQPLAGAENARALEGADLVVLAFPHAGVSDLLPQLAPSLAGKIILDVANPLVLENRVFRIAPVAAGSAGEEIQSLLPESHVVSGFKNESAEELCDIAKPLRGDVVVCGDHPTATARVLDLIGRIPRVRGVDAGTLVNARSLEAITALLLNRHRAITAIEILGLPS